MQRIAKEVILASEVLIICGRNFILGKGGELTITKHKCTVRAEQRDSLRATLRCFRSHLGRV